MRDFKEIPQQIDGMVAAQFAEAMRDLAALQELMDDISTRMRAGELLYMSLGLRALVRRNKKLMQNIKQMKLCLDHQIDRKYSTPPPAKPPPKAKFEVVKVDD